jgi:hypothetical protein
MHFIRNHPVEVRADPAFSIANAAKIVGYCSRMAADLRAVPRLLSGGADATLRGACDAGHWGGLLPLPVDYLSRNLKG